MRKRKLLFDGRKLLLLVSLFVFFSSFSFVSGQCDPSGCLSNISINVLDGTAPSLNLILPENNSFYNTNESIALNHTESDDSAVDTIWYYVLNSTGGYEISNTTITGNLTFNVTGEGNYTLYLFANDTSDNINSTSAFFIIDLTSPNVSIVSPAEGYDIPNYVSGSLTIPANVSVSESNLDSCWYSVSGSQTISNTSFACSQGYNSFTFELSTAGSFTVFVYANDSAGNENSDNFSMTITAYSGPSQGTNPPSSDTPSNYSEEDKNYNTTIICKIVGDFLHDHSNYTYEQRQILKSDLAIALGVAISDELANKYLINFGDKCPDYVYVPEENPDDNSSPEEKPSYAIWWISGGVIVFILILFVILDINYWGLILAKRTHAHPKG